MSGAQKLQVQAHTDTDTDTRVPRETRNWEARRLGWLIGMGATVLETPMGWNLEERKRMVETGPPPSGSHDLRREGWVT